MRRCGFAGFLLFPVLFGCAAGQHSLGFIQPKLMDAYIPLFQQHSLIFMRWAAAFTIAPHIAVTNDHNLNLIPAERVLARSRDYDLLFFRTDEETAPAIASPRPGMQVIAYGQGGERELREAKGVVAILGDTLPPRCEGCAIQRVLAFDAKAGVGFSGGPVVDAQSGAALGITFGYLDGKAADGGRRMYAYDIDLVIAEMHRLLGAAPPSATEIGDAVLTP